MAGEGFIARARRVIQAGWEAAATTRVNRETYRGATGERLNEALDADREKLFSRAEWMGRNNPILEGVVNTYSTFLAGRHGPMLRCLTASDAYNKSVEQLWSAWWLQCDFDGLSSGADRLLLWCCQNWHYGEFFEQLVTDSGGESGLPQLRLRAVHPDRLERPISQWAFGLGADGVELDETGRRVRYWVRDEVPGRLIHKHESVPVKDMVHFFEQKEPGQLRGVPWMASALPTLGEIHELDKSVLTAMRTAADLNFVMKAGAVGTDFGPEVMTLDANAEFEIKRGQITALPVGWEGEQIKAEQPGLNHVEYRHDRLREVGRGRGMSLLHVLADGSNHNYSSMRGDNQMLDMTLGCDRGKLERKVLGRLLRAVIAEAQAMGLVPPLRKDFKEEWVWPVRAYIDPQKEAAGQNISLQGGTKTLHTVCAENGVDYDDHLATLEKEVEDYRKRGLVHPSQIAAGKSDHGDTGKEGEEESEERTPSEKKKSEGSGKKAA